MPGIGNKRFATQVEPHLEMLYRAAYRLTHKRTDAEDLVQDTCIRACLKIDRSLSPEQVKSWLLRVLYNVFVDGARRVRVSPIDPYEDGTTLAASAASTDPDPEECVAAEQREAQLHSAWQSLEPGHRLLLALRAEGYSLAEVSDITGIEMDALTMRLYRARQNLTRALNEKAQQSGPRLEAI